MPFTAPRRRRHRRDLDMPSQRIRRRFFGEERSAFAVVSSASAMRLVRVPRSIASYARPQLRRLAGEDGDVPVTLAVDTLDPPGVLEVEVGREREVARFKRAELFRPVESTLIPDRGSAPGCTEEPPARQWLPLRSPRKRRVGKIWPRGFPRPRPQSERGSRVTSPAAANFHNIQCPCDRALSFARVRRPRIVSASVPQLLRAPSSRLHGRPA